MDQSTVTPLMSSLQNLSDQNPTLTMSSREIAEITGKQHRNVLADIRKMLTEIYSENDLLKFQQIVPDASGRSYPVFNLPQRETMILMAGYSVELRARIVDRWMELERQVYLRSGFSDVVAMNPLQALVYMQGALVDMKDNLDDKAKRLEYLEGKSTLEFCVTDAANMVGCPRGLFFEYLNHIKWIFHRPRNKAYSSGQQGWSPYSAARKRGYVVLRIREELPKKYQSYAKQVGITPKGVLRIMEQREKMKEWVEANGGRLFD